MSRAATARQPFPLRLNLTETGRWLRVNAVYLLICTALAAAIWLGAHDLVRGTKMGLVLAVLIATAPITVVLGLIRPMWCPFALYAFLVPFNQLVLVGTLGTLAKMLGIVSSAAIVFWILRSKRFVPPPLTVYAWGALIAWMVASAFWAYDPQRSLIAIQTFAQLYLLFVIVAIAASDELDVRVVTSALSVGGIVAALYGGYLFYTAGGQFEHRMAINTSSEGVDPNHFAASLLLPMSLVTVTAFGARGWTKLALLGGSCVLLAGIYASASRGAMLSVVGIMLYMFIRTRYRFQIATLATAAVGLGIFVNPYAWSRVMSDYSGGSGRLSIWQIAFEAFKPRWLAGVGMDNFSLAFNREFLHVYVPLSTDWSRNAHNLIATVGVELGVIGLLLVFAVWLSQFVILRHIRHDHPMYGLRVGVEAATLGLLVAAMFLDLLYFKYAWLVFMATAVVRSASLCSRPDPAVLERAGMQAA